MAKFDDFISALKTGLTKYAQTSFAAYSNQAIADGQGFIDQTKQDLATWTQQLEAGQIKAAEFRFNVKSKLGLAALTALTQAGLAKVAMDQFTSGLEDLIVNTATSTFL